MTSRAGEQQVFIPSERSSFTGFWSESLQFAAAQDFIQVSVMSSFFFFLDLHAVLLRVSFRQGHVFPCWSSPSPSPLPDVVEVEVGT